MGKIRQIITDIEQILASLGYRRAKENFTLSLVPRSVAHKSYTFGQALLAPVYLCSNRTDYSGSTFVLNIAWKVFGPHNAARTFQEGYLELLDAYEQLEDALVKTQLMNNSENNSLSEAQITPLLTEERQDILLLTVRLSVDAVRLMQ